LALFLSLALHIGLGLAFVYLPSRGSPRRPPPKPPEVDVVVYEPDEPQGVALRLASRKKSPRNRAAKKSAPLPKPLPGTPNPGSPVENTAAGTPRRGRTLFASAAGGNSDLPPPPSPTSFAGDRSEQGTDGGPAGAATTFFQVAARGRSLVYVIDHSMSMGPGGLRAARHELLASLRRLPDTARFQIVFYNSVVERLPLGGGSSLVRATAANKARVAQLTERYVADGTTYHRRALASALALHPDEIFLLTDGGGLTDGQVRELTGRNAGRTSIHVIELITDDRDRREGPLRALARQNHGTYRAVRLDDTP
jgi:hypothetical protein